MTLSFAAVYLVVSKGWALPVAIASYIGALVWIIVSPTEDG